MASSFLYYRGVVQSCVRKQGELEKEQAANAELLRLLADLESSKVEGLLEVEALKAKLRSLEVSPLKSIRWIMGL